MQVPDPYLDYIIDPSFQGVNRVFASSFENSTHRTMHTKHGSMSSNCRNKGL